MAGAVLVCLLAAGCGTSSGLQVANSGQTTPVTRPPATQPHVGKLDTISFADADHGWAAGPGVIIATTDGGASWSSQYRGNADISGLQFVDALHGWAVAADSLLHTTDGGASWKRAGEPSGLTLTQVAFTDPNHGWGVAQKVAGLGTPGASSLVRTANGGASWSVMGAADSVCVSGGDLIVGSGSQVLSSADDGASWTNLIAAVHQQWLTATVQCAGPGSIWVLFIGDSAAGSQSYLMDVSTDAGRSWTPVVVSPLLAGMPAMHTLTTLDSLPGPFDAVTAEAAVFLGQCPACSPQRVTVLRTADGGSHWARSLVNGFAPTGLDMVDAGHGWMTTLIGGQEGRRSAILATADGGATWHPVFPK